MLSLALFGIIIKAC